MEDLPKKLGRYDLIELLATGGMAHIYRARLETTGGIEKELVIKRVLPHLLDNREFLDMFVDEARITMPLNHGNIVQVFEFGQDGKDYFLAMEYVRGRNLDAIISRLREVGSPMPISIALFIASEVAKGLDYAHRFRDPHNRLTGIIHRDVSPQNILVGFQGEVKLTDFGIAKARSKIHQTTQGIIRGKAVYLSPEQAECKDIDGRSDQFSLASVLFEMLTGARPFEGDTELGTLQKVRQAQVPPVSNYRSDIPKQVEELLTKALSLRPSDRFDTCGGLQIALSRALSEQDPEFTSASLAEWIRELFSADITHEIEQRTVKDHLLDQLGMEHRQASSTLSTGEILQMGTVSMQSEAASASSGKKSPSTFTLLAVLISVILAAVAWYFWPIPGPDKPKLTAKQNTAPTEERIVQADAGFEPDAGLPGLYPGEQDSVQTDGGPVSEDTDMAQDENHGSDSGRSEPTKADKKVAVQKWSFLNINASPWAFVEIDGKRQSKETPLFRIKVAPGRHRLRFINPALKIDMMRNCWVRPGHTKTISVELKSE